MLRNGWFKIYASKYKYPLSKRLLKKIKNFRHNISPWKTARVNVLALDDAAGGRAFSSLPRCQRATFTATSFAAHEGKTWGKPSWSSSSSYLAQLHTTHIHKREREREQGAGVSAKERSIFLPLPRTRGGALFLLRGGKVEVNFYIALFIMFS